MSQNPFEYDESSPQTQGVRDRLGRLPPHETPLREPAAHFRRVVLYGELSDLDDRNRRLSAAVARAEGRALSCMDNSRTLADNAARYLWMGTLDTGETYLAWAMAWSEVADQQTHGVEASPLAEFNRFAQWLRDQIASVCKDKQLPAPKPLSPRNSAASLDEVVASIRRFVAPHVEVAEPLEDRRPGRESA